VRRRFCRRPLTFHGRHAIPAARAGVKNVVDFFLGVDAVRPFDHALGGWAVDMGDEMQNGRIETVRSSKLSGSDVKILVSTRKRSFKCRYMAEFDGSRGTNKIALVSFLREIIFAQKSEIADSRENKVSLRPSFM
jgi:hypothetical protein